MAARRLACCSTLAQAGFWRAPADSPALQDQLDPAASRPRSSPRARWQARGQLRRAEPQSKTGWLRLPRQFQSEWLSYFVMFECLLIQYELILYSYGMDCKKIFEKFLGVRFASETKVFWEAREARLLNARFRG